MSTDTAFSVSALVAGPQIPGADRILTPEALAFVAGLHRRFAARRDALLVALYELRHHANGLNAGRWDYLFSMIKNFRDAGAQFVLPDRASVTMAAPPMRAYSELLVSTCHRRGAFAMGGMAAFIPSRRDPEVNEQALAKVREDVHVSATQLLDMAAVPGRSTQVGLRLNVEVGVRYLEAWLRGNGAVGIHNLMEDAATAEISRSQVWQWVHNRVGLDDTGEVVTPDLVRLLLDQELAAIKDEIGARTFDAVVFGQARALFEQVALDDEFADFLTVPAYRSVVAAEREQS